MHQHETFQPAAQPAAQAGALRDAGVRGMTALPLAARSGAPPGLPSLHDRRPHRPDERSLRLLDLPARQAADILAQRDGSSPASGG